MFPYRALRASSSALIVASVLSSCAHDPSQQTMSNSYSAGQSTPSRSTGRPEVSIPGASKKAVLDALVAQMTAQGYSVSSANDYRVEFDKKAGAAASILGAALMGRNVTDPVWRVSFNAVDISGSVQVTADMAMIRNPGTAIQDRVDMNSGKNRDAVQNILEAVRMQTQQSAAPRDSSSTSR
jgi:hypothetical protein